MAMANLIFKPETKTARYFTEQLSDDVGLDMIWVPGGEFGMGSADDDAEGYDHERPQHRVTVPSFFMGRYPVTQTQWRAVAAMPRQKQEIDPDPAYYKGSTRPIESVSWYDAVEFCDRLSQHSGRTYRLPSEAEWEYACRAHTTTPFYFGTKLTSDLANFDNSEEEGVAGTREGTTPIDTFSYANGFGLSDMHGNVLEWCLDHYHDSYEGAPNDGSAWIDAEAEEDKSRVFRGGSWSNNPRHCRSANRNQLIPREADFAFGFRVVCSVPRALG